MDPNFTVAHLYLYWIYLRQGKLGDARQAGIALRQLVGPSPEENAINSAIGHAVAGHNDLAFASLEKARKNHMFLLPYINVDPLFDGLRGDPRYQSLLQHMNLTPSS